MRDEQPALIHSHGYKAGLMGKVVAKLTHTPIVCSFHAGEKCRGKLAVYDGLDRFSACLADMNYAASDKIACKVKAQARVLNNFIHSRDITMTEGGQIAFVGRLSPEKSPEIFCRLSHAFPQESFHLYGDGELADSLRRQFLGQKNVVFHGFSHMHKHWQDVGLLVITSRFEGLPLAALEAMARGIPVLSTEVGQLGNLVDHGRNGWLVDKQDLAGLSHYLNRWCALDELSRLSMKESAIHTVERRFTEKTACKVLLHDYAQISAIRPDTRLGATL